MPKIGQWIRRDRRGSRYHYADSIVAGDVITHCGRRMSDENVVYGGGLLEWIENGPYPDTACHMCLNGTVIGSV